MMIRVNWMHTTKSLMWGMQYMDPPHILFNYFCKQKLVALVLAFKLTNDCFLVEVIL